MTLPRLAVESPYGRLYKHPDTPMEEVADRIAALKAGLLFPSVTNIIGILDKPYLPKWYAKLAAEEAVATVQKHPGLVESKPERAVDWFKKAAPRYTKVATDLGDLVHDAAEHLSKGEEVELDPSIVAHIDSWKRFLDDYQPAFLHQEASCFGEVPSLGAASETEGAGLGYAGTADFVCEIQGRNFVGDYKSGKSIHSEASQQLASLAHADELILDTDEAIPMPEIDGGLVLHLTPTGYTVWQVDIEGEAWDTFILLRHLWGFHARNLAANKPLFMREVASPADLA